MFTQSFWDERYAAHDHVWSGRANPRLVEQATNLPPGVAVDVGCGEGADVVWLAERGWRVTGVDVSVVALDRARQHAAEAGLANRTSWLQADLVAGDALPGNADLVSVQYLHVPDAAFAAVYAAIAAAVRPGGVLLVVGHHPADRATGLRNPRLNHLLFGPERITGLLTDGWQVELADAPTREVAGEDGHPVVVTDTVVLATRLPV